MRPIVTFPRLGRITAIAVLVLAPLVVVPTGSSGASEVSTTVLVSDAGAGTTLRPTACWRGYPFTVETDITVTSLFGGSTAGTTEGGYVASVALFELLYNDEDTGQVRDVLASAEFAEKDVNSEVVLDEPVTLRANVYYFLATGGNQAIKEPETGDGGYYRVDSYDSAKIPTQFPTINYWGPSTQANKSMAIDRGEGECYGAPSEMSMRWVNSDGLNSTAPAIGFAYYSVTPDPTTTTPDSTTTTTADPVSPSEERVEPRFTG